MMPFRLVVLLNFLLFAPCSLLFAQQLEIGGSLGGSSYLGDLNQYNPVKISGLSGGVFLKTNFTPHWALGFHFNVGSIKGNDATSKNEQFQDRNLSFKTSLQEVSVLGEFNLFDLYAYNRKGKITPYLFVGIGAVIFNPTTIYQGNKYELRDYKTEGQTESYKKYTLTFPYGAGVKYKIRDSWTVFSQVGYRTPLTDFIDDVSGVYAPATAWTGSSAGISSALADRSGENTGVYLGEAGTQRGDFRKRDTYMFVGIGISYTFVSQKCFTF
jgi:opacity protein-like surface antigen